MTDYGIFESAATDDYDQRQREAKAAGDLDSAIKDVTASFGGFLSEAQDRQDFNDRVALVKNDMMNLVANHLMPVPGVMRRIVASQRPEFKERADLARGASNDGTDDQVRSGGVHSDDFGGETFKHKTRQADNKTRVNGKAQVGDLVCYEDMANQGGEVFEVIRTPNPRQLPDVPVIVDDEYVLRNVDTGEERTSDLAQHGWFFWARDTIAKRTANIAELREFAESLGVEVRKARGQDGFVFPLPGGSKFEVVTTKSGGYQAQVKLPGGAGGMGDKYQVGEEHLVQKKMKEALGWPTLQDAITSRRTPARTALRDFRTVFPNGTERDIPRYKRVMAGLDVDITGAEQTRLRAALRREAQTIEPGDRVEIDGPSLGHEGEVLDISGDKALVLWDSGVQEEIWIGRLKITPGGKGFIPGGRGSFGTRKRHASEGYALIVSLNGEEANEVLDIIDEQGEQAAIEYLSQWDYGERDQEVYDRMPSGSMDYEYRSSGDPYYDGYILYYNNSIGYAGLVYEIPDGERELYIQGGKERTATRYLDIVFMQGDEGYELVDIISEQGEDAAIDYLSQWDSGDDSGQIRDSLPSGSADYEYESGDYVLTYNLSMGYGGLVRKIED